MIGLNQISLSTLDSSASDSAEEGLSRSALEMDLTAIDTPLQRCIRVLRSWKSFFSFEMDLGDVDWGISVDDIGLDLTYGRD